MTIKAPFRLFVSNAAAIVITSLFIEGFKVEYSPLIIAMAALALTGSQLVIRPILKAISFPINAVTLGLFNLVINAFVLFIAVYIVEGIAITTGTIYLNLPFVGEVIPEYELNTLFTLFAASITISIINWVIKKLLF